MTAKNLAKAVAKLEAEREQHIRAINDTLADLAVAELKLAEANAKLDTIRRMKLGRAKYADPATQVEAYEALLAMIGEEAEQ